MKEFVAYIQAHLWILEVFLIVLATGFVHLFVKLILKRIDRRLDKTHNLYDDALLEAGRKPLSWAVWIIGVSMAAEIVGGTGAAEIFQQVATFRDVAVIGLLVWFAIRFIRYVEEHIVLGNGEQPKIDLTTARAVGKLLRASVMITGVLLVLQAFGFSISGVLAFGGIGGIAIGFAARDLLANFFGAIMVFLDRPFSVGDWVRSPDREIEGTVEEIGWRLTLIRTFDKRPLYIPNSIFTSIVVENPSRMLNRRIYETIGIRYDDVDVMRPIVDDVKAMLKSHEAIDTKVTLMVNFVEFGPSSLDFFVYCFTKTTVWTEFHEIKQDVLLKIAEIIDNHGAEIAFPTQTLHLAAEPEALKIDTATDQVTEEQQALSQSQAIPADLNRRLSRAMLKYSHAQIERALDQLSIEVTVAFQDQTPQCVCVLPEGLVFAGMLLRRLVFPLTLYNQAQPPAQSVTETLDLARPILLLGTEMEQPSVQSWLDWLAPGNVSCVLLLHPAEPQSQVVYAALPAMSGLKVGCGFQLEGFAANWGGLYLLDDK